MSLPKSSQSKNKHAAFELTPVGIWRERCSRS